MAMHRQVGKQEFVKGSLNRLLKHLKSDSRDVREAISTNLGTQAAPAVSAERDRLIKQMEAVKAAADSEQPINYVHYASRFDVVGLYQSVMSKLFSDIPGLQGYGDHNPIWAITMLE